MNRLQMAKVKCLAVLFAAMAIDRADAVNGSVASAGSSSPASQWRLAPTTVSTTTTEQVLDLEKHVYTLQDHCPPERYLRFHEQLVIRSQSSRSLAYKTGINCTMRVLGLDNDTGIILTMRTLVTRAEKDILTLDITGNSEWITFSGDFYNGDSPNNYHTVTDSQGLSVTWATEKRPGEEVDFTMGLGFDLTATAYKTHCPGVITLSHGCFKCATGALYIDSIHVCNGRNNCGDFSDERNCGSLKSSKVRNALVLMTVGIALLCVIITVIVWISRWVQRCLVANNREKDMLISKDVGLFQRKQVPERRSPLYPTHVTVIPTRNVQSICCPGRGDRFV